MTQRPSQTNAQNDAYADTSRLIPTARFLHVSVTTPTACARHVTPRTWLRRHGAVRRAQTATIVWRKLPENAEVIRDAGERSGMHTEAGGTNFWSIHADRNSNSNQASLSRTFYDIDFPIVDESVKIRYSEGSRVLSEIPSWVPFAVRFLSFFLSRQYTIVVALNIF